MQEINRRRIDFLKKQVKLARPYWDKFLVVNTSSGIEAAFSMLMPLFFKIILDYAYPARSMPLLNIAVIGIVASGIIQGFSRHIAGYLEMYLNQRITSRLQSSVFTAIMALPLSFHNRKSLGERNILLQQDTLVISNLFCKVIPQFIQALISLSIAAYVIVKLDAGFVFIALIALPFYFMISRPIARYQFEIRRDLRAKTGELFNHIFEKFNFVKLVKSFGKEKRESVKFCGLLEEKISFERENFFWERIFISIQSFFTLAMSVLVMYYAGLRVMQNKSTIGDAAVLAVYLVKLYSPFMNIVGLYKSVVPMNVSLDRLIELEEYKREESSANLELKGIKGEISLRGVFFRYNEEKVLEDINLDIAPRSITAICGETGIGKTTLIDLIMRFYLPDKGKISIDGLDLSDIKTESLRRQIALVPQDYPLFRSTIAENILYGNENASGEDFQEAVSLARLDTFVNKFKDGFDTALGGAEGINLSSGQRQMVAIARAVIRNPRILILDEITSALDVRAEHQIWSALKELSRGMTVIIISHRLSSVMQADNIVMLADKTIKEAGSFQELMAREGLFYQYYQMQYFKKPYAGEYSRDY